MVKKSEYLFFMLLPRGVGGRGSGSHLLLGGLLGLVGDLLGGGLLLGGGFGLGGDLRGGGRRRERRVSRWVSARRRETLCPKRVVSAESEGSHPGPAAADAGER